MTLEEIASKLQIGDITQIAKMSGYSFHYVTKIFSGARNNEAKGAKIILSVATKLIEFREDQKLIIQSQKTI